MPGLLITGHAIARYAQRVLRVVPEAWSDDEVLDVLSAGDIRRIRAAITDIPEAAAAAGCVRITVGGASYVISDGRVITVMAGRSADPDARPVQATQAFKEWRTA